MYFSIICLTALQFARGSCEADTISVAQAFNEDELVQKIVTDPPTEFMSVTYPATLIYETTTINLGTKVHPVQTLLKPQVSFEADKNSFNTIMFIGPDLPPSVATPPSQLVHWLVVNIPGNNVSAGYEVASYFNPTPYPEGYPYIWFKYLQKELLDTSKIPDMRQQWPNFFCYFLLSRTNFYYFKFAEKYNMTGPIAGNFLREFYTEIVGQTVDAVSNTLESVLNL